MGEHLSAPSFEAPGLRRFMKDLLRDVHALEQMIAGGMIESKIRRIGVEQELFLVDHTWSPAPIAHETLARLDSPEFVTELAKFNLEFNLPPLIFGGDCLSQMERQIVDHLRRVREAVHEFGSEAVLTGILPTIDISDLGLENMTENPRYAALNESLMRLRGEDYEFRIKGIDELLIHHNTVMLEACNSSFQVHFQVGPGEFAKLYNMAQAAAAPLLAICVNSPLLFGKRLWNETRIALFQQSIDTRNIRSHQRSVQPRVSFGTAWVRESALEIFREDIARFRVLMATDVESDALADLAAGRVPTLSALRFHAGTVYRWNRVCYGISDGRPHLRIENRYVPSGPTPLDEIANAAFWFGLLAGMTEEYADITRIMSFDDARSNFLAAARFGLGAQFTWIHGAGPLPVQRLVLEQLLPMARDGLATAGIAAADAERYLAVIEARVSSGRTGAAWALHSLTSMEQRGTKAERISALVGAAVQREKSGKPVHEWDLATLAEAGDWKPNFARVEQYMKTDLYTVNEDELIDLVVNLMEWQHIRHVPVEDHQHRLVGLVTFRSLLRYLVRHLAHQSDPIVPVSEIMQRNPISVTPNTPTLEALAIMKKHHVGSLPVVEGDHLVGLVTEEDFMIIAGELLEQQLRD
jgi:predicted transcriptional regulator